MATKSTNKKQLLTVNHINSLSPLTANFMSARSQERGYSPQVGSAWWMAKFCSTLELNQFVSQLYSSGFQGDLEAKGCQVEIHTQQRDCIERVIALVTPEALQVSVAVSDAVEVVNDAHALLNNQAFNGALVQAGDQLHWLQIESTQSLWLVLQELSEYLKADQVVHFDPKGEIVLRGDSALRGNLLNWLSPFCK
ncbi:hypothetical protein L1D13_22825 [Vibrio tubiashii]|uniref:hypothetical protein n=1 Tax=Vibrio tubiashii TaxID=29498 RepID=UPI001EFEBB5B|nr:hypothetical protein [Vibrio tubiashii]MCG9580921.1 hypothetical protein [Vibrio tubiashii]MCG9614512.1 hypothetical protein [Vibrio tubiashii]MCG9689738.1 hypothetical protein [Vibrio tubiashii]